MLFSHSPLLRDRAELCCFWACARLQAGAYGFCCLSSCFLWTDASTNLTHPHTPRVCPCALQSVFRVTGVKSPSLSWGMHLPRRLPGMVLQAHPAWSTTNCWETRASWGLKQLRGNTLSGLLEGVRGGPCKSVPFGRPSLQEGHWGAGVCPEKGNEAGEGSREQVLWGAAEGTGAV